jgi:hypothetical protein
LQRKCACGGTPGPTGECEACRKKRLQRKANDPSSFNSQPSEVPPIVDEVLRSPGQPLDPATRAFMEPRFGSPRRSDAPSPSIGLNESISISQVNDPLESEANAAAERAMRPRQTRMAMPQWDFSRIRVHADARAAQSAREVSALAYTIGEHIVFAANRFAPNTQAGQRLLAHELAHVIQQDAAPAAANMNSRHFDHGSMSAGTNSQVTNLRLSRATGRCIQRYGHSVQNCKEEDLQKIIWPGDFLARQWLDEGIAAIGSNPLPPYVGPLLRCYFMNEGANLNKIRQNLAVLKSRFDANDYFYDCVDCAGSKETKTLGQTKVSRWSGGEGPIRLCVNNLRVQMKPDWMGAQTIIHEFCHRYLNFYGDVYCDDCCKGLSQEDALKNPDSYAGLVRDMHFKKESTARKTMKAK